ncbi:MAG: AmmeMemoRadiSam system protein A [Anaerolineae bacterium]|nr:AmmeMemoRadiSam system protein A [Anaerolineae bacterium]
MDSDHLTEEQGQYLVQLARTTIQEALEGRSEAASGATTSTPSSQLEEPGASFVTLHTRAGALRGCIGSLVARRPLVEDVRANALAAAFEDPRFPPLTAEELPDTVIEVSVLTPPQRLWCESPTELIDRLRPNIDGVIVERGWHRATFLPQVWEQLPRAEDFLTRLCYKAGMSGRAWTEGNVDVSIYGVQKFEETGHTP